MVRGNGHDVGGSARRAHVTLRRRRRRRSRPVRRRRVRTSYRRGPRRLVRVPVKTNARLKRIQLSSRDNIQLHPVISRSPVTSASSTIPRLVSYSQPRATGAVQYVTVPDYTAGYQRVDAAAAASQASPIFVQLQNPLTSSSSSTLDSRIGLVAASAADYQVIRPASRKATTSLDHRQTVNPGSYGMMIDGGVVVPLTLRQSSSDVAPVSSQEVIVPLQVRVLYRQKIEGKCTLYNGANPRRRTASSTCINIGNGKGSPWVRRPSENT